MKKWIALFLCLLLPFAAIAEETDLTALWEQLAAYKADLESQSAALDADISGWQGEIAYVEMVLEAYKAQLDMVLEKKNALEASGEGKVIFSYEESFGYMLGGFVRDKDAVTAALLLTEMAAWYYDQGMTLYDALQALYKKSGFYAERTLNLVMPGLDGLKKMADLMHGLRTQPPAQIAGVAVVEYKDYKDGSVVSASGAKSTMELSGSNVLRYEMADGTSVIVRPSGTEPKVKVYILANGEDKADCDAKVTGYAAWAEGLKN
jgi:phosphoglucomutase